MGPYKTSFLYNWFFLNFHDYGMKGKNKQPTRISNKQERRRKQQKKLPTTSWEQAQPNKHNEKNNDNWKKETVNNSLLPSTLNIPTF